MCVNRRWVLADTWSKVCCPQTCLTSHSKNEPVGRLEWISNSIWNSLLYRLDSITGHMLLFLQCSQKGSALTLEGNFCKLWQKKKEINWKREGKNPLVTWLPVWKKKGSGWRHFLHCHSQIAETSAIFNRKVYSVSNPESGSTPVLQGNPSVHYCVRLRKEEKGGSIGGKEICLFVWEGLSKKAIL